MEAPTNPKCGAFCNSVSQLSIHKSIDRSDKSVSNKSNKCVSSELDNNFKTQYELTEFKKTNPNISSNSDKNIANFHKSINFTVYQCSLCHEAGPLKSKPKSSKYICRRCLLDKETPKRFSSENFMIPSAVPEELQDLTQIEEMLIARALPIMKVYIKPGGQRSYSGHCINFPQRVSDLAFSLPRFPKDIPVIVVTMKHRETTFYNNI